MLEYAIGVIDVKERNLFDRLDQERMLNSPNKEEAFRVFFDTDIAEIASVEKDLEKILEKDLLNLRQFISNIVKEEKEEVLWFLFLKFDALNLKLALKKKFLKEGDGANFGSSICSSEEIDSAVNGGDLPENPFVASLIKESLADLGSGDVNSFSIESAVDLIYLNTRLVIAKKLGGLALEISKLEIDVANIKNRVKGKELFLKGGGLPKEDLEEVLGFDGKSESDAERFIEVFDLSLLLKEFKREGSEAHLEKELDSFIIKRILEKELGRGNGLDKVIAFFYKKMAAYSNIRLIFFSKDSGLSVEKIRKNLLPL